MTTRAQLRKAALALPEVEEVTRPELLTFEVHGTCFASLTKDGWVRLVLAERALEQAVAQIASAESIVRGGEQIGVRFPLASVNGMELNSWVTRAWMSRAPERLAAAARTARQGEAPAGPDALPSNIGKPATRALLLAGVRSLTEVAGRSEAELLGLHGVGPRAIRLLAEAMGERGLTFRAGGYSGEGGDGAAGPRRRH